MNHTIRSLSEAGQRLDANFHLAAKRLEARTSILAAMGQEQAITLAHDLMGELSGEQRDRVLGVLRSGSRHGSMGTFEAHTLVRKHPFLSLALLEEFLPQARQTAEQKLVRAQHRVTALGQFADRLTQALDAPASRRKSSP